MKRNFKIDMKKELSNLAKEFEAISEYCYNLMSTCSKKEIEKIIDVNNLRTINQRIGLLKGKLGIN